MRITNLMISRIFFRHGTAVATTGDNYSVFTILENSITKNKFFEAGDYSKQDKFGEFVTRRMGSFQGKLLKIAFITITMQGVPELVHEILCLKIYKYILITYE